MEGYSTQLSPTSASFALAAALAIIFNTLLTWAKESSTQLHDAMAALLGHHWTTHGVMVVAVFLLSGWILSCTRAARVRGSVVTLALLAAVIFGGLGIFGFFLREI